MKKSPILTLEESGLDAQSIAKFSKAIPEGTTLKISPWTKKKISLCVASYIKRFPEEYAAVKSQVNRRQWANEDAGHAAQSGEGIGDMIALFEIPETLYSLIDQTLSAQEMEEFKSQNGSRWFAQEFVAFRAQRKL